MFIDISDIASEVSEVLTIQRTGDVLADEYGIQVESTLPEISVYGIVTENVTRTLDVSTGSYLPKVTYDIYIPYSIAKDSNFVGAVVTRFDGSDYVISSKQLVRPYASHVVYEATQRRV